MAAGAGRSSGARSWILQQHRTAWAARQLLWSSGPAERTGPGAEQADGARGGESVGREPARNQAACTSSAAAYEGGV